MNLAIDTALEKLYERIQSDPAFKGPAGPAGPQGPAGKDAEVNLDELAALVAERLPPIYPQWIDEEGNVIDSIPGGVRLGQTMPMRLTVSVKEAIKRAVAEEIYGSASSESRPN